MTAKRTTGVRSDRPRAAHLSAKRDLLCEAATYYARGDRQERLDALVTAALEYSAATIVPRVR